MTTRIEQETICDCCGMSCGDKFEQNLRTKEVSAVPPTQSRNLVMHQGIIVDLCMMCMAPVHTALKEKMLAEKSARDKNISVDGTLARWLTPEEKPLGVKILKFKDINAV